MKLNKPINHHDWTHCSDWEPDICPPECFRAQLSQDLREMGSLYPYPISYGNFRKSGYCMLDEEGEEEIDV